MSRWELFLLVWAVCATLLGWLENYKRRLYQARYNALAGAFFARMDEVAAASKECTDLLEH